MSGEKDNLSGKDEEGSPEKILVHMCCGPCSVYPLKTMLAGRMEVWGFFYNPNIHPRAEFMKRLEAVKKLSGLLSVDIVCDETYRGSSFLKGLKKGCSFEGRPPKDLRCAYCYRTRLEETARASLKHGFKYFSSSLLYSRYQDHELIRRIGLEVGRIYGILFHYEDFREGWYEGKNTSREIGLYRQKYCGCIYSKIERNIEKATM